jgi:hypothetical protein
MKCGVFKDIIDIMTGFSGEITLYVYKRAWGFIVAAFYDHLRCMYERLFFLLCLLSGPLHTKRRVSQLYENARKPGIINEALVSFLWTVYNG